MMGTLFHPPSQADTSDHRTAPDTHPHCKQDISDMSWSPDGYTLLCTAQDGTVASFTFTEEELGKVVPQVRKGLLHPSAPRTDSQLFESALRIHPGCRSNTRRALHAAGVMRGTWGCLVSAAGRRSDERVCAGFSSSLSLKALISASVVPVILTSGGG